MRYSNAMRSAAVVFVVVLSTAGVHAQRHREHGVSAPPAPFVPQTLSTGGITTLPPPPPPSPFAARPGAYTPRYDRPAPFRAGRGNGVSIYDGTLGFFPSAAPAVPPPAPDRTVEPALPRPEPPKALAPPAAPPPPREPQRVAVAHGPDTFYVIPGCYAGNLPPRLERLPKGCDVARMRTTPVR